MSAGNLLNIQTAWSKKEIQLHIQNQLIFLQKVKCRNSLSHFLLLLDPLSFFTKSRGFSPQQMSQCWVKRGACLCICSPLGRSLLPGLKSSKESLLTSQKPGSFACSTPLLLIHRLRLSNSFLCLFATLYLSTELQRCSSMSPVIPLLTPSLKLSSPGLCSHLTPAFLLPSHPRRCATADRMLCCGEPAANGKRRRE